MNNYIPKLLTASILLAGVFLFSSVAMAQENQGPKNEVSVEDLTKPQEEIYRGIIPGKRDDLAHVDHKKPSSKKNLITWIGFVPEKTRTRVFLQVNDELNYSESTSDDGSQIILTFENTKVENYNLMRFIDASHFDRSVKRIDASRKGKTVTVTITVTPGSSPNISRKNNYIYLDFPYSA